MDEQGFLTLSDAIKNGWRYGKDTGRKLPYEIILRKYGFDQRLLRSSKYGPNMEGPWFDFKGNSVE